MPAHAKQLLYLERFFPGLVAAVEALGLADIEAQPPSFKTLGHDAIRYVDLRLTATLADGKVIAIRTQRALVDGAAPYVPGATSVDLSQWRITYQTMHYGKAARADPIFRFDQDEWRGHVHILPNHKDHVPSKNADPETFNMDPRAFVAMVSKFRRDKIYPIKRK